MKIAHMTTVEASAFSVDELDNYVHSGAPASGEYPSIRIPGITALADGTLLMYGEYRQGNDWSAIDICMRSSADGGRTWSERTMLACGKGRHTCNNPVMFACGGDVLLLYCMDYGRVFSRRSTDGGKTWSAPAEHTGSIEAQTKDFFWNCIALGPGHGTVLSSGRLIVPVWLAYNRKDRFSHHPSVTSVLFSDDGGESWRLGPLLDGCDPNESALAELPDGRLRMSLRNTAPEKRRYFSESGDGGESWTPPLLDESLPDPGCAAGMCRAGDALLFSSCDSETARENLTLKRSSDGGKSWERLSVERHGGYSDVICSPDARCAYMIYECDRCRYIRVAEIGME